MNIVGSRGALRQRVVAWYRGRPSDDVLRRVVRRLLRRLERLEHPTRAGRWFDLRTNGEMDLLRTLARHAQVGVVVDVGANVGQWFEVARAAFPAARIVLVEIAPPLWAHLERLVAEDECAELVRYGLAAEDGTVVLHWFPESPALSTTVAFPHVGNSEEITAPVRSVARFLTDMDLDTIDVVKVDVEGAEFAVVAGLEELMMRRRVGVVQFEYGEANILSHTLLHDYAELADRTGYRLGRLRPAGVDFTPYRFAHDDFRPRNMVLCRPDLVDYVRSFEG